jgi:hypothetical protein
MNLMLEKVLVVNKLLLKSMLLGKGHSVAYQGYKGFLVFTQTKDLLALPVRSVRVRLWHETLFSYALKFLGMFISCY